MEWSTDTKDGYDDLEVCMEYGYVFISSTARNHAKMATFSFKLGWIVKRNKINEILMSCWTFSSKASLEVEYIIKMAKSIPTFSTFDRWSMVDIDGVVAIAKSDFLFDLMT